MQSLMLLTISKTWFFFLQCIESFFQVLSGIISNLNKIPPAGNSIPWEAGNVNFISVKGNELQRPRYELYTQIYI